jgi:ATP-dependent Clp protease ATP-binding subunit ClpC
MFERFTERARAVLPLAHEEARLLRHNYIGTEHILLGLLREEESLAARVLVTFGAGVELVRAQVVRIVGPGERATSGQVPFSPRAKKVLELALREALGQGYGYIDTRHLLLGIIAEGEGVAMRALQDLAINAESLRAALLKLERPGEERLTSGGRFLARDVAARAVLRAAKIADAAGRAVEPGDLILAFAETDDLSRGVITRYVSLTQLATDLEEARDRGGA